MSKEHIVINSSNVDQVIHTQRIQIEQLTSEVHMLKRLVAEETSLRYTLYKKLAGTDGKI